MLVSFGAFVFLVYEVFGSPNHFEELKDVGALVVW
jgi:hypothetical protein